jgi:3-hydroxyacyl-CoA dehydrogenase/enoyl-CoA hydratase/3-hydroxybutyryl-CoA epimerase
MGPHGCRSGAGAALTELVEHRGPARAARTARGFYDYPESGPEAPVAGAARAAATRLDADSIDIAELKHRFLVVQALEAARTVEEGVVTDPREADVGSILGFGFAPFTGGALSYIDFMGASVSSRCARRWRPSTASASRQTSCCSTWRRTVARSTARPAKAAA